MRAAIVNKQHSIIHNENGIIFVDFLFALVLAAGVSIVLFALTFTFSMVEVSQYVVFASSRAFAAAHLDYAQQKQIGQDKFKELLANSELANLLADSNSHWFLLGGKSKTIELKGGLNNDGTFEDYVGYNDRVPFVGARSEFQAKLLSLQIPLLGKTDEEGNGFKANLTAFLIREPTQKECFDLQIKNRYALILNLDDRYKGSGTTNAGSNVDKYVPMEDNGC